MVLSVLYTDNPEEKDKKHSEEGSGESEECPVISEKMTTEMAKKIKNRKLPGLDNIPNELLK